MALTIVLSVIELAYIIVKDMITPPVILLEINEILEIFGLFLFVLIGIELLETIKAYLEERSVRLQVVFLVALIAISRKVIILDIETMPEGILIGLGVLILALSVAYFLIKRGEDSS